MNAQGQHLEEHQWKNRVLIVKTSDAESTEYNEQLEEFDQSPEGFHDRKLILYKVVNGDFTLSDFSEGEFNDSGKVSQDVTEDILDKEENFEIILIGLDGGVKLRQSEILKKEELFDTIDSMPMRQKEMKKEK